MKVEIFEYRVKKAGWFTDAHGHEEHKNAGRKIMLTAKQAQYLEMSEQIEPWTAEAPVEKKEIVPPKETLADKAQKVETPAVVDPERLPDTPKT